MKINGRLRWICWLAMAKSAISGHPFSPAGAKAKGTGCAFGGSARRDVYPAAVSVKIGFRDPQSRYSALLGIAYAEPAIDGRRRLAQTEDEAANRSGTVQAKSPAYRELDGAYGAGQAAYSMPKYSCFCASITRVRS
ncbi:MULTISPECIES: hypothetical protein [Rhodomicrobium]|uniref:hypothetical protein n=1 Tax=Rhodomicrobium TaxID=1068 RepID=UPI000F73A3E5|nr:MULTISPECIES: hypothetical protein [Rhodomicrobium]